MTKKKKVIGGKAAIKRVIKALEKELRLMREDILSGNPMERMKQRLLENTEKRKEEIMKKIENEINFEI